MPHVELPQAEFKIVLLGDTNTGKTSLVLRFVEGYYRDAGRSSTVGAFFLTRRLTANHNITCKLLLWDTAGQAQFQKLAATYYQHAAAAILTYDVTNPQSLVRLASWLQDLQQHTGIVVPSVTAVRPNTTNTTTTDNTTTTGGGAAAAAGTTGAVGGATGPSTAGVGGVVGGNSRGQKRQMVLAVVACKSDLPASPGLQEEAERLAQQVGAVYVETSAKENTNVQDLFLKISEKVLKTYQESVRAGNEPTIPVTVHGGVVVSGSPDSGTGGSGGAAGAAAGSDRPSLSPSNSPTSAAAAQANSALAATPEQDTARGSNHHGNSASRRSSLEPLQDEKKDDDLRDPAAVAAGATDKSGGSPHPRVTCEGIAGNILSCGATDSGRSCCIM